MSDSLSFRFAFFGTSHLSVCVLTALEGQGFMPELVVTSPDRQQGRGLALLSSPVARWAQARGIRIVKPATLKDGMLAKELSDLGPWDVFVVAMYAKLIPSAILDLPRCGSLNVHPSLLPKFRGPSPILSAILADERQTGVSVMQMTQAMDAGPVVAQKNITVPEDVWPPRGSVFEEELATEGGQLLAEVLPEWVAGTITVLPQDDAAATYTKKFSDADARLEIDPAAPLCGAAARAALLRIRTFDKSPRAHFFLPPTKPGGNPRRVIITDATVEHGTLRILRVIPEGKQEMDYSDLVRNLRS